MNLLRKRKNLLDQRNKYKGMERRGQCSVLKGEKDKGQRKDQSLQAPQWHALLSLLREKKSEQ